MALLNPAALSTPRTEEEFRRFVLHLDAQLCQINQVQTAFSWAKIFNAPTEAGTQEQIDQATDQVYTTANHESIKTWKSKVSDPSLQRWADVFDRAFTMNLIEKNPELRRIVNHVSDRYLRWRPKIDGQEITYTQQTAIFREAPDRELRRKAYLAFWELGDDLRDVTRQMFHLRNSAARELGFPTYADLKLTLVDEVDRQWLARQFDEMERTTEPIVSEYLQEQAERAGLLDKQPWDSQYLFDRDCWPDSRYYPADHLERNLFAAMMSLGLDSGALGISVHWYDSQAGGQCMRLGPQDIRLLVGKADGMLHYNTAFHEYGHAVHSAYYNQPYTLRRESGLFTEGMAMLMERWLHYPTWMRRSGVPDAEIERYRHTWRIHRIYRHRRLAPTVMAELAAWDNPDQDLDEVFGQLTARYLQTEYQPRPFASVARWTRPVQLQSYFIADLIASQTHAYLRAHVVPLFDSPDAVAHIRQHYWAPGNAVPWQEKVKNCTGKALSYDDLAVDMTQPYPAI